MMAKIVKGRSFSGCIKYILDKGKDTKLLDAQGVRLKSVSSIIHSFIAQAKLRPKLGISVGHISLNFSAQDKEKLSNEFLVKVTSEYMQKMGITNTQYIVAQHFDKEHPHIHICFNRVDNNGNTISDQNDEYRSVKICRKLTEKCGLHIAEGKEKVKQDRLKEPDKTKYEIHNAIKDSISQCKNWKQLSDKLNKQGIEVKYKYKGQTDEKQGVIFTKNNYSFNGSKVDRIYSYSKIDAQLNWDTIQSHSDVQYRGKDTQQGQQQKAGTGVGLLGAVGDILGGLSEQGSGSMQLHGDNPQEEAFRSRIEYEEKKRQRKKKGIRR